MLFRSSKHDDEEDCALAAKVKKNKGKKFHSRSEVGEDGKEHNMSKVKFFHYHEHGHIATNYPQNKKKNKVVGSATGEDLASQFDLDFSLIACIVSSATSSEWYLDSGASFHMMGDKEIFSSLEEKDIQMHIEMGDDGWYGVTRIGTITFQTFR